ncbi:replication initiation protein [uncultured Clostridium sp.]|uniref:replication initiation protein n=1 Tax=uncultured Clostridium sp. TaxID=59620 RepID=UPI00262D9EAC|nr:replication initiation protein [uncultured Clostridium sp.]
MLKDNVVTKSNDLNLRAYQLNRTEQLLVLSIASMVQPQDENFKTYELHVKDFMDLINVSDKSKYVELPKITKSLMMKVIEIKKTHSLLQVAWFSSVEHRPGEGIIEVEFSPKLKPYLLNLKDNFVSYALNQVAKLSSKYSIRLYELLKQQQFKKSVRFEMSEFRELIGLNDSIYPRYSNMKPKVLLVGQKEINNKSDIFFDFEEIKTGRKVTSIKFNISSNKDNCNTETAATLEEDPKELELIKQVQLIFHNHKITEYEAGCILKDANNKIDLIKQCYKYTLAKDVPNVVGYMRRLVRGFNAPRENIKKGSFNDYEQRTYDFDALEKKLLGWDNKNIE